MEICSLDWDIAYKYFQTILTITIAGVVYFLWHKQKGKEVISNEAKEIFKLLEEVSLKSQTVFEQMLKMVIHSKTPNDFEEELIVEFRNMNIDIRKRLNLIRYKNNNKKTLLLIDLFDETYGEFILHYFHNNSESLKKLMADETRYRDTVENLKKDMYEYALYKKIL
ncbi:hypothetical protein MTX11_16045 (plasmid) [Acinetobacter lwoffii]|jgi:hypothetical protein|uniref:hypothetical protein n=1 Tax=Acinetobacter lwoffii TaxID=28090 RepID=UPI001FB1C3C7|nr:hypothetical protein [Acinetobacter lwoffii]MCJ0929444.1 hypothetical protein [Acinetobacter lwoffii]